MEDADPFDSDAEGSDSSDSFSQRQLTAAEAEGDTVPAIEYLTISGSARPGCVLTVDGSPVGGAVRCHLAWVRCSESGSSSYIKGANGGRYLVTADDVGSFLAIEAIPVAEDERMGEMIRTFANKNRKISCDPQMHEQIERAFFIGHASFNVSMLVDRYNWKKVLLEIKRDAFYITQSLCNFVSEKFSPSIAVTIPWEHSTGLLIHQGNESILLSAETSLLRDVIVLTMRLFITAVVKDNPSSAKAARKQKRRKRFFFF